MLIVGLTGSIGVGKSNVAKEFRRIKVDVFDADKLVHKLLGKGGAAVNRVKEAFPKAYENNAINRKILGDIVFKDNAKLKILEGIIHPLVRRAEKQFIDKARSLKKKLVILDIPLLFEKDFYLQCDYTIVVIAPLFIQMGRVLRRRNMTIEKFLEVNALQIPQARKKRMADFVIKTGLDKRSTKVQVRAIYTHLKNRPSHSARRLIRNG